MIWGENPLFSETSKSSDALRIFLFPPKRPPVNFLVLRSSSTLKSRAPLRIEHKKLRNVGRDVREINSQRGPQKKSMATDVGSKLVKHHQMSSSSVIIRSHQKSSKVISYCLRETFKVFACFCTLPAVYTGPFQPGKWTHSSNCLWDSCLVLRSLVLQPQQNMAPRTCFCTFKQHE